MKASIAVAASPGVAPSMSFLDRITVLVLTWNEAPNIGRTLSALSRFGTVVVLDSGSSDDTAAIVAQFKNARLVVRPFDTHAAQWNFGVTSCGIDTPWVLALDADYVLGTALVDEIAHLSPGDEVSGYRMSFRYCVDGQPLAATLYPPVTALFRRDRGEYVQAGHTQRLALKGETRALKNAVLHDDRKTLSRWLQSQLAYARLEAQHLDDVNPGQLRLTERVRRSVVFAPFLVFFYVLFVKGCIRDGWRGWFYTLQRVLAEVLIALELLDRRLKRRRREV